MLGFSVLSSFNEQIVSCCIPMLYSSVIVVIFAVVMVVVAVGADVAIVISPFYPFLRRGNHHGFSLLFAVLCSYHIMFVVLSLTPKKIKSNMDYPLQAKLKCNMLLLR